MRVRNVAPETKSLAAAIALVVGLVVASGGLTAAKSPVLVGPDPAGMDSARVAEPIRTEAVITADDRPDLFAGADRVRTGFGFPAGTKKAGRLRRMPSQIATASTSGTAASATGWAKRKVMRLRNIHR